MTSIPRDRTHWYYHPNEGIFSVRRATSWRSGFNDCAADSFFENDAHSPRLISAKYPRNEEWV